MAKDLVGNKVIIILGMARHNLSCYEMLSVSRYRTFYTMGYTHNDYTLNLQYRSTLSYTTSNVYDAFLSDHQRIRSKGGRRTPDHGRKGTGVSGVGKG